MSEQENDPLRDVISMGKPSIGIDRSLSRPYLSGIMVECNHGVLPFAQASAGKLIQTLKTEMNLDPDPALSNALQQLQKQGLGFEEISLKQLDSLLPVLVKFEDGSIRVNKKDKDDFIQVTHVVLSEPSSLAVSVYGDSSDAERALAKLYECLCAAAGLTKQWSEGKKAVGYRQYTTVSIESLDCSFTKLFSEQFAKCFDESFKTPGTLLPHIGSLPIDPETEKPVVSEYIGAVKLESVGVNVARISPDSGAIDRNILSIRPQTKHDAGKGMYAVESTLPFERHNEFVAILRASLDS